MAFHALAEHQMLSVKTRISVAPDGTLTGRSAELPVGDHDAEIVLLSSAISKINHDADALLARVRALQVELGKLAILDDRTLDEIIGYNQHGYLD
jgi:hypothetical protein